MEMGHREEFLLPGLNPLYSIYPLTPGAVPVPLRIVGYLYVPTTGTSIDMTT